MTVASRKLRRALVAPGAGHHGAKRIRTVGHRLDDALAAKGKRERDAADRIFGRLPGDQSERFQALWDEFEAQETLEARFANAVDRLQPLLQNEHAGGGSWCTQVLADRQVLTRMAPIETSLPGVWPHVLEVIEAFCRCWILRRTTP